ncbi:MAG: glycoside hydrolase family 78 protein [Lachnospiraceae bacterium]|nr:glycoside hydrolase family 78 protein [Lachnospiraceae bacterium]
MKAVNLKTADLINPIGIDQVNPRFSWNCINGIKQRAYQVIVKTSEGRILYDTKKVESSHMHCRYEGETLVSRLAVTWVVGIWDENDHLEWSNPAFFEMGLLNEQDWKAKWICGVDTNQKKRLPADYYYKKIDLSESVKSARVYATSLGVYTAYINGIRVSSVLAPGSTFYDKRMYYQTYNVTDEIKNKKQCEIEFVVGDGWLKGKLGADQKEYLYGSQTKLFAQLEILYESGKRDIIATDASFKWCNDGPIIFSDLKDGEIYDARKKPSYDFHAVEDLLEKRIPIAPNGPLIHEHEEFIGTLEKDDSNQKILNFRQNMAGYLKFSLKAPRGKKIRIRLFEVMDHGEYSNTSLSFPDGNVEPVKQEICFIASGEKEEYCPSFFYSGFQYALVEGLEEINPLDFKAVAIYTDIEYGSQFRCSNEKLNQFFKNSIWSMKSNFIDVPTDCPQREKSGWTGDAQVFCKTATYFADTKAFYGKWLKDVRDCQRENGMVVDVNPIVIPVGSERDIVNGSCGWADAAIIIPYTIWKMTGDDTIIYDNYELMIGWMNYVISLCKDKSMFTLSPEHPMYPLKAIYEMFQLEGSKWNQYIPEAGFHWGEWSVPESEEPKELPMDVALMSPKQEVTCAYTYYSMTMLEEMLQTIGKSKEAKVCKEYANGSKEAYHVHWIKNHGVETNHMAELVRPVALGLADDDEKKVIAKQLNQMVIERNYHVGTGFLSTPFLLYVLAENGYVESAYRMLENEEAPGWLAMVNQGATTVWESYLCFDENKHPLPFSFNHYSLGAVCSFLFDSVCGIRIAGENQFVIKPQPGGTLEFATAKTKTVYGEVACSWEKQKETYLYEVFVPANTVAEFVFLDGRKKVLQGGNYKFYEKEQ